MSVQTLQAKEAEKLIPNPIPDYLIYEVSKGKPIYYKGYKDVLNGTKTFEEIMADSRTQTWLKTKLGIKLSLPLEEKGFEILTGELGLMLPLESKRAADVSIYKMGRFKIGRHYSDIPPDIVIEIDVQANTEEVGEMKYIQEKINEYLDNGVQKVIWVFTEAQLFITAIKGQPWLTQDCENDIEIMPGVCFNLKKMLEERRRMENNY